MYTAFDNFIKNQQHICIIQAENPDGDSLGSALALEEILTDLSKDTSLYCPVDIPKYLRYYDGWSRVENDFPNKADAYIIVDTASKTLLSKLLLNPIIHNRLSAAPVFIIDHHETTSDLEFNYQAIIEVHSSNCRLIYDISKNLHYPINPQAAKHLLSGILSDTLGLTSQSVKAEDYHAAAELIELGARVFEIEEERREYMKKSPRILDYKADLIKRVEYHLDGALATVLIPFEDIQEFSDEYNPNVLILEELRLVVGVEIAVAIKTYPDGKLTGKIRSSKPIAEQLAAYFGGGGHSFAAGFRIYQTYEETLPELISASLKLLEDHA